MGNNTKLEEEKKVAQLSKDDEFHFIPRPDAHVMEWNDLLEPVKIAVRDMLDRIEGATQREIKKNEKTANSFLVHGIRGTGKTTVLLCAKAACDPRKNFFPEEKKGEEPVLSEARRSAGNIKNVEWLDILDLEPLLPDANPLTAVLTRVKHSLHPVWVKKREWAAEVTSILEESKDSAGHQLDQLSRDATLMWGDIRESDTRSRANQQSATADIYAEFRQKFSNAMEVLSQELGRRKKGNADEYYSLILPIDNIDRSPEHLSNIVRLAQMVSSPRLWLIMAGDHQDVDMFLERAYWKELIRSREGADAAGKIGLGGEDEALVMARRQAAAASHRLFPPSHRVCIDLVRPEKTLAFSLNDNDKDKEKISDLLKKIPVVREKNDTQEKNGRAGSKVDKINLYDLFDVSRLKEQSMNAGDAGNANKNKTEKPEPEQGETGKAEQEQIGLTEAAQRGLTLPARGVLDLWQIAYEALYNKTVTHEAEYVARTMLGNFIAESAMSSEAGLRLRDQILQRTTPTGGTILDFGEPEEKTESMLQCRRLEWSQYAVRPYPESTNQNTVLAYSTLEFKHSKGMVLRLLYSRQSTKNRRGLQRDTAESSPESGEMLPDPVAPWLTILHDVIRLGAEEVDSSVNAAPSIDPTAFVECSGVGYTREWPTPAWDCFVAHDVNGKLWQDFFKNIIHNKDLLSGIGSMLPRLLAAGWIACALDTFSTFVKPAKKNSAPLGDVLSSLQKKLLDPKFLKPGKGQRLKINVKNAEKDVMKAAADIYNFILEDVKECKGKVLRLCERKLVRMRTWLEYDLRLLLSNTCVPTYDKTKRGKKIIISLKGTELAKYWKTSWNNWESWAKEAKLIEYDKKGKMTPFSDLPRLWEAS